MAIPNHGERYAEVPKGTYEEKTAEKVVIFLSSSQQDQKQHRAVQEKAQA
jgi:hypothetical protein